MKLRTVLVPAATFGAVLALALPAAATATFDPATGTGFVGKGDVQVPFGWSNAQLQSNAINVDFVYSDLTEYEVTCEQTTTETFTTGPAHNRKTHTRPVKTRDLSDASTAVAYDSTTATRKNPKGNVNGFQINGTTLLSSDTAPAAGDTCTMDDGTQGVVLDTEEFPITVTSTTGDTLSATHSTKSPAVVWTDDVSTL